MLEIVEEKVIPSYVDKKQEYFSLEVKGLSLEELKAQCLASRLKLEDFRLGKTFFVPGIQILSLLRTVVRELAMKNQNFPLRKLDSFDASNGGTKDSRVFIDEDLIYQVQFKSGAESKQNELRYLVGVNILKKQTGKIVLSGLFKLTQIKVEN